EYHLRRRYGIGQAEYDAMVEAQGGTCAVCPGEPQHVDHDHETGAIRGILCSTCNQALGNARDNINILIGLANYLQRQETLRGAPAMEFYRPLESPIEVALARHLA